MGSQILVLARINSLRADCGQLLHALYGNIMAEIAVSVVSHSAGTLLPPFIFLTTTKIQLLESLSSSTRTSICDPNDENFADSNDRAIAGR